MFLQGLPFHPHEIARKNTLHCAQIQQAKSREREAEKKPNQVDPSPALALQNVIAEQCLRIKRQDGMIEIK